ncbi:hypothetical protein ACYJ1Y_05155 [Natrialbaceae archaeon A-gly3]
MRDDHGCLWFGFAGLDRVAVRTGPSLEWGYDSGNIVFEASGSLEGDLYVATNGGEVHRVREVRIKYESLGTWPEKW